MDNTIPLSFEEEEELQHAIGKFLYPSPPATPDGALVPEPLPGRMAEVVEARHGQQQQYQHLDILPVAAESLSEEIEAHHGEPQDSRVRRRTYNKDNTDPRKGIRWTDEEHRLFIEGVNRFGKGAWRRISLHCVKSKTPTQVSSHAQKFYLRNDANAKPHRRRSIHDLDLR